MADVVTLLDEIRAIARLRTALRGEPVRPRPLRTAARDRGAGLRRRHRARIRTSSAPASSPRPATRPRRSAPTARCSTTTDRVLLIRRADDGLWGLVAGWVDPNEAPEQTIVREFAEELGVVGRVEQLVGTCFRPAERGLRTALVRLGRLPLLDREPRLPLPGRTRCSRRPGIDLDDVTDWHLNHEQLARLACDGWSRGTDLLHR